MTDSPDRPSVPVCFTTAAGAWLGPYQLIAPLALGVQAEVWKAVRFEPRVELVALKLLSASRRHDPIRRARFRHESERCARLQSPALLPVYDFGVEQGVPYMVMPLVEGFSLLEILIQRCRCQAGAHPLVVHRLAVLPDVRYRFEMVQILATIARALHAAHSAGVVHRDVKPDNILLDGRTEDRAFLVDFGLGRDLDSATLQQLRTGEGTLRYMAPEKLLCCQVDEVRCDLFALGVTLFEALTLCTPRQIPPTLPYAAWPSHLASQHTLRPRAVRPDLPANLDAIVTRAMARDPLKRYPSTAALAEDLDHFVAVASTVAPVPVPVAVELASAGDVVAQSEEDDPIIDPNFVPARSLPAQPCKQS